MVTIPSKSIFYGGSAWSIRLSSSSSCLSASASHESEVSRQEDLLLFLNNIADGGAAVAQTIWQSIDFDNAGSPLLLLTFPFPSDVIFGKGSFSAELLFRLFDLKIVQGEEAKAQVVMEETFTFELPLEVKVLINKSVSPSVFWAKLCPWRGIYITFDDDRDIFGDKTTTLFLVLKIGKAKETSKILSVASTAADGRLVKNGEQVQSSLLSFSNAVGGGFLGTTLPQEQANAVPPPTFSTPSSHSTSSTTATNTTHNKKYESLQNEQWLYRKGEGFSAAGTSQSLYSARMTGRKFRPPVPFSSALSFSTNPFNNKGEKISTHQQLVQQQQQPTMVNQRVFSDDQVQSSTHRRATSCSNKVTASPVARFNSNAFFYSTTPAIADNGNHTRRHHTIPISNTVDSTLLHHHRENNNAAVLPSSMQQQKKVSGASENTSSDSDCECEDEHAFKLSELWEAFRGPSLYGAVVPYKDTEGTVSRVVYIPYLSALVIKKKKKKANRRFSSNISPLSNDNDSNTTNRSSWTFSFFDKEPPHLRRPFYLRISQFEHENLRSSTSQLDPNSWFAVLWLPYQNDHLTMTMTHAPTVLVFLTFSVDTKICATNPGEVSHGHPLAIGGWLSPRADPDLWAPSDRVHLGESKLWLSMQARELKCWLQKIGAVGRSSDCEPFLRVMTGGRGNKPGETNNRE